jgi:nitroreductase
VENMNLAAVAEGLGCCTMGAPLEIKDEVNKFLGVTDPELELLCGITLGYPDHEPPKAPRKLDGRVEWLD